MGKRDMNAWASTLFGAIIGAAFGVLVFATQPAAAQSSPPDIQQNAVPCTCRYAGEDYGQGQCACIDTGNGPRYACCGKVLNNSSWVFSQGRCPVALGPWPKAPVPGQALAPGQVLARFVSPIGE